MLKVNIGRKRFVFLFWGVSSLFTVYFTYVFKKRTVLKYNLTLHTESHYDDQILGSASK